MITKGRNFGSPHSREYAHLNHRIQMLEKRAQDMEQAGNMEASSRTHADLDELKERRLALEARLEEMGFSPAEELAKANQARDARRAGPRGAGVPKGAPDAAKFHLSRRIDHLDSVLSSNADNIPEARKEGMINERAHLHQRYQDMFGEAYDPSVHQNQDPARGRRPQKHDEPLP
eukprot:TRINITY_DN3221_c0_g1_i1.p2 TRINITY_DN3221_c0_g1~~TRINITY_DN3221_c0_g1_i1.p2  ORF type:complete len:175 (+),score=49.57 TRINITY_DN3221_c0_g1_i1:72-596(+)